MPLLDKTGYIVDAYSRDAGQGHAPLVTLDALPDALAANPQRIGVEVAANVELATLRPHLSRLALIAIIMPAFSDGRAFSLARRLRREGFSGTLRITGPLIADQWPYALAVGVDQLELPETSAARQPAEQWQKAAETITLGYQRGLDRASSILDQRRASRQGGRDVA